MATHHRDDGEPTRASHAWTGLVVGLFVLLLILVFILQNTKQVPVHFVGLHGKLPLGVALLLSSVAGGLVTVLLGVVRITQLRRRNRTR